MSTVQHEAIGRLLDIWLASLDWSKSGQSNAIVWTENVVSREHRNQQINHLSSINFFVRKTILKIWDWSPIYHYQRSLGHVWHVEGPVDSFHVRRFSTSSHEHLAKSEFYSLTELRNLLKKVMIKQYTVWGRRLRNTRQNTALLELASI